MTDESDGTSHEGGSRERTEGTGPDHAAADHDLFAGAPRRRIGAPPPVLDALAAWTWRLLVVGAGVALVVVALIRLRLVVLPAFLALVLSTFLAPPARWLRARGAPASLAALTVVLVALAALTALLVYVIPEMTRELSELGEQTEEGVRRVERWLRDEVPGIEERDVEDFTDDLVSALRENRSQIVSGVVSGALVVVEVTTGALIAIVALFFFLKDDDRILRALLSQVPPPRRADARAIAARGWAALSGFVRGAATNGLIEAVLVAIALAVIGVPLVVPLALITFFSGFLPVVGAILTGLLASLVALVSNGLGDAILVALVFTGIQQLQSNVLEPLILGHAVRLHPLVILFSLTAGGVLGGLVGAFIAVPMVASTWAMVDEARRRAGAFQEDEEEEGEGGGATAS